MKCSVHRTTLPKFSEGFITTMPKWSLKEMWRQRERTDGGPQSTGGMGAVPGEPPRRPHSTPGYPPCLLMAGPGRHPTRQSLRSGDERSREGDHPVRGSHTGNHPKAASPSQRLTLQPMSSTQVVYKPVGGGSRVAIPRPLPRLSFP